MTRGTLRNLLRKEVRDVPGTQWNDAEINDVLNNAYALVQKEVRKVDPEAHLTWDYIKLTANTSWYLLPPTFGLVEIAVKGAATDTTYTPVAKKRHRDIRARLSLPDQFYTIRGDYIGLFPAPTATINDGMEIIHNRIASMGADDDTPRLKEPIHMALVWWAKLILLGDTDESAGETRQRLNEVVGDLGQWYGLPSDDPIKLIVER